MPDEKIFQLKPGLRKRMKVPLHPKMPKVSARLHRSLGDCKLGHEFPVSQNTIEYERRRT
jgi:hypothetical protein